MDSNYAPLIDSRSRTGQTSSHSSDLNDGDDDISELNMSPRDQHQSSRFRRQTVDAQPTRAFNRTGNLYNTGSSFSIENSQASPIDIATISHLLKPKAAAASTTIGGSASSPSSPKTKSRTGTLERSNEDRHRRRDSVILAPHFHEQDVVSPAEDDTIVSIPLHGAFQTTSGFTRATTAPTTNTNHEAFGIRPVATSPSSSSLDHLLTNTSNVTLTPLPSTMGITIILNVGGTEYHTTPETLSRAESPSMLAWIAVHAVQTSRDQRTPTIRSMSDTKTPSTPSASVAAATLSNTLAALSLGQPSIVLPPTPSQSSTSHTYHIDRNPKHFPYVLDYLRDKRIVLPKDDLILREIGLESKFYQLQGLFDAVQNALRDVIMNQHLTPDDIFWRDCVQTLDHTFEERSDGLPELGRNTFINMLRRLAFQRDPMLRVVHATYKGQREYRDRCLEILRTNCTICDRTVYYRPIGLREGRETGCPCHPPTGTWDRSKQLWTCCGSPQFQGSGCKQTGIHYTTWTFFKS